MKRFFHKPEDRIELTDGPVLVSREWNLHNIKRVLNNASALGFTVQVQA